VRMWPLTFRSSAFSSDGTEIESGKDHGVRYFFNVIDSCRNAIAIETMACKFLTFQLTFFHVRAMPTYLM